MPSVHSINLSPGDRVVLTDDRPDLGLKAGEVLWVRSASDRVTVMRADGQGGPFEIDPAHVRPAVASDFESAASARRKRHASDDLSPWFKRLIGPIALIVAALVAWQRWQHWQELNRRPGPQTPPPPRVQEAPMPRER